MGNKRLSNQSTEPFGSFRVLIGQEGPGLCWPSLGIKHQPYQYFGLADCFHTSDRNSSLGKNMIHSVTRLFHASVVLLFALALGVHSSALTTSIPKGDLTISLTPVCSGLTAPVTATHSGDKTGRLFIVDQIGQVRIYDQNSEQCSTQPYLDIRDRVVEVNTGFDERGLLGLAFHPKFAQNGRLFVRYSAPREGVDGEPCFGTSRGCHYSVLSEFTVDDYLEDTVDSSTERVLFTVDQPQFNHNGGHVAFGPDGYLYFSLGDGGGANDGLGESPPLHGPIGHGQNIETTLGSILRIDVDAQSDGLEYAIPESNPFAGNTPGADEIYAYGMRNPYRFSFDRGGRSTRLGDLYVADVGQGVFEEINMVVSGGNYGWVLAEGFHCFDPVMPQLTPSVCTGTGMQGEALLNPVAEYNHNDGLAVIGGYVYRGKRSNELKGKYVFGDFSRGFGSGDGRLFYLNADGVKSDIFEFKFGRMDFPLGLFLFGFGQDQMGEIYVLTSQNLGPVGSSGQVWHLQSVPDEPEFDGTH